MIASIRDLMTKAGRVHSVIKLVGVVIILIFHPSDSVSEENKFFSEYSLNNLPSSQTIYRNPRVYNVDYSFEIFPDPAIIDRDRDLKVWIPTRIINFDLISLHSS